MDYVGQWGGEWALDTPGPLNGIERSECHLGPPLHQINIRDTFIYLECDVSTLAGKAAV
jgi:hypothetical protein